MKDKKSKITDRKYRLKIQKYSATFGLAFFIFGLFFLISGVPAVLAETPADIQDAIARRQKQIDEIAQQIDEYWKEVDARKAKGDSVENEIAALKAKIAKSELEIRGLRLAIEEAEYQLGKTENEIAATEEHLEKIKIRLAASLRILRHSEEVPFILRFAQTDTLSDIFLKISELERLQGSLHAILEQLKEAKGTLEKTRDEIAREKQARENLQKIEEAQKAIVDRRKRGQAQLLQRIENEKNNFIGAIVGKKRDLEKIKEQITYLTGAGVSAEEAVRFGELAAIRTGVRTAFLIAVLEVESRLGMNVGTGNWKKDMHPRDHDAFFAITEKLGRDPDTTPVSRKPSYGWGGAMGPAQFLPNTWMAYEAEVARLTGHNPPDPWSIEDAFTAAAVKLSRQGAAAGTREGERKAAKAYIGGSPNCSRSICNYYANLVLDKAEEIEQELR